MTNLIQSITLLDKTSYLRKPYDETYVNSSGDILGIPNGDLLPWFIKVSINHSTLQDRITNATLTLRLDIDKRFVRIAPILIDEKAKSSFLIEWKATQNNFKSRIFVFAIKNCTVSADSGSGFIISLTLVEQWGRLKHSLSSTPHRFVTPYESFFNRLMEFNFEQLPNPNSSVTSQLNFNWDENKVKLPKEENLRQSYVPNSPSSLLSLVQDILDRLGTPNVTGGVFTDYYMDFDPDQANLGEGEYVTRTMVPTVNAFGAFPEDIISNGSVQENPDLIVFDPKAIDLIDAVTETTNITDNDGYRNNVIIRGDDSAGTLPMEHCKFASQYLHAVGSSGGFEGRPLWDSGTSYKLGDQVKMIFRYSPAYTMDGVSSPTQVTVLRFFECIQTQGIGPHNLPFINTTEWKEDFTLVPKFSGNGRYMVNDVVYQKDNNIIKYYKCISDSLASSAQTPVSNPSPEFDQQHWQDMSVGGLPDNIPPRSATNFTDWVPLSPWTEDLDAWVANLSGASAPYNTIDDASNNWGSSAVVNNIIQLLLEPNFFGSLTNTLNGFVDFSDMKFLGYAVDWNITRETSSRNDDFTNHYSNINVKHINFSGISDESSIPNTSANLFHGMRVLTNGESALTGKLAQDFQAGLTSGVYTGNDGGKNRIAEYDASDLLNPIWRFSRYPIEGDQIVDDQKAQILIWNDESQQSGGWKILWSINKLGIEPIMVIGGAIYSLKNFLSTIFNLTWNAGEGVLLPNARNKPTPFHLVSNILRTRGASGIPSSAIEYRFRAVGEMGKFNATNPATNSVGVWLNCWYPFPRRGNNIGKFYGGSNNSLKMPFLNTDNYTLDHLGKKCGYNSGLDTEDLGTIRAIAFSIKVGFFNKEYHDTDHLTPNEYSVEPNVTVQQTNVVVGFENIPMIFWAVDMFDRVWFQQYTLRANNQWQEVVINFGEMAQQQLHKARYDEFPRWFGQEGGYIQDWFAFTTKQREYTGVEFNWKFVKGWGTFYSGTYDKTWGFYRCDADFFGSVNNVVRQVVNDAQEIATGSDLTGDTIIYSSSISIDELRFLKELVVTSSDERVTDSKTIFESHRLRDYFDAKKTALARKKRLQFFPQTWHMKTHGDVRMRVGHRFKIKGEQISNGEIEMVCAEVDHIIDHSGYHMNVVGQRKFESDT